MQHQQHVEDKEEIMSVPEDVIIRNSEKTKNLVSMPLHIPSHWKECVSSMSQLKVQIWDHLRFIYYVKGFTYLAKTTDKKLYITLSYICIWNKDMWKKLKYGLL